MKIPGSGQQVLRLRKGGGMPEADALRIPRQTLAETTDWKRTETTRYLCAAAHMNSALRDYVIRTLSEEKHRAIAISYGVDMATVLEHCLVARNRKRVRNWIVAGGIAVSYGAFALTGVLFGPVIALVIAGFLYLLIAWSAILAERVITEHNTVRLNLSRDNFNPDCVEHSEWRELPELPDARLSNVMIYSGFSPFVGSGTNLGSWSFAVDTSKGKQELGRTLPPQPFEVGELYVDVCSAIASLGLPNVAVEDKLCVNGQDIRGDQRFLPDLMGRPCTSVDQKVIDNVRDNPTASVRHYKQIRVVDWHGELVFSMFVRFAKAGRSLFVESTSCVLTPIHGWYQKLVDAMNPDPGILDWIEMGLKSLLVAAQACILWPFWVLGKLTGLQTTRGNRITIKKTIRKDPTFDRGALSSIREFASSPVYQRYFQKLDKEMYVKVLEQQIMDTILKFLDAKDVDTTDLKERQTSIINSGVFVSGDLSLRGESVALGAQAKAVKQVRAQAAH